MLIISDIWKYRSALNIMVKHSKMLGLLELKVEGTKICRSIDSYMYPTTERNNPKDLNLTANPMSELLISHGHSFAKSSHVHFSAHKTVHPTICSYVYDPSPHKISKVDLQGSLADYKISSANRPSSLQ